MDSIGPELMFDWCYLRAPILSSWHTSYCVYSDCEALLWRWSNLSSKHQALHFLCLCSQSRDDTNLFPFQITITVSYTLTFGRRSSRDLFRWAKNRWQVKVSLMIQPAHTGKNNLALLIFTVFGPREAAGAVMQVSGCRSCTFVAQDCNDTPRMRRICCVKKDRKYY